MQTYVPAWLRQWPAWRISAHDLLMRAGRSQIVPVLRALKDYEAQAAAVAAQYCCKSSQSWNMHHDVRCCQILREVGGLCPGICADTQHGALSFDLSHWCRGFSGNAWWALFRHSSLLTQGHFVQRRSSCEDNAVRNRWMHSDCNGDSTKGQLAVGVTLLRTKAVVYSKMTR